MPSNKLLVAAAIVMDLASVFPNVATMVVGSVGKNIIWLSLLAMNVEAETPTPAITHASRGVAPACLPWEYSL